MQRSSSSSSSNNNTSRGSHSHSACAACKHQRRKCSPDCLFLPYFPSDKPDNFRNVHKLFGVSNVRKALEKLDDPYQRQDLIKTMIYEANAKAKHHGGCFRIIHQLKQQVNEHEMELRFVQSLIDYYRSIHFSSPSSSATCSIPRAIPLLECGAQYQENQELMQPINQEKYVQELSTSTCIVKNASPSSPPLCGGVQQPFADASVATDKQPPSAEDLSAHIAPFLGGFGEREVGTVSLASEDLVESSENVMFEEEMTRNQIQISNDKW